jgi:cell division protein ZapA (FtsZ GTPase activity inhibitor)
VDINEILAGVIATLAPILVAALLAFINKRMKAEALGTSERELDLMRKLVFEAINVAAKKSDLKVKLGSPEDRLTSAAKLELATGLAKKMARKHGVSEGTLDLAEDLIESSLAQHPNI